ERHPRVHIARGDGLLLVALDREGEPPLLARPEITDPEPGLRDVAGRVDEPPPVRRERRTEGRAVPERLRPYLPRLPIEDGELVVPHRRVVLPAARPPGEPDLPRVGAERRARRPERGRLPDQLDPRAALDVVEPELALRAAALASHDDVLPVRRPLRRLVRRVLALRDLDRVLQVEREDPDVLGAITVRGEDDPPAVRAEAWLRIERHPPRQRCGLAARDRDGV